MMLASYGDCFLTPPHPNPQEEGAPFVGSPLLLIQYIRDCRPRVEGRVLQRHPEALCRGDGTVAWQFVEHSCDYRLLGQGFTLSVLTSMSLRQLYHICPPAPFLGNSRGSNGSYPSHFIALRRSRSAISLIKAMDIAVTLYTLCLRADTVPEV
jgi:hypothetical protein